MNYTNIYECIIQKRKKDFPTGYYEKHHILPRCLGGSDEDSNIVYLSAREHFICHWLLTKIYKDGAEHHKMLRAALMMKADPSAEKSRYINSRAYENLKIKHNKVWSELQRGCGNNQYGTRWIFCDNLKISKKIKKTEEVPDGWCVGRKIKFDDTLFLCKWCSCEYERKTNTNFCSKECKILFKKQNAISAGKKTSKKCSIDGVVYDSVTDAANSLGMLHETLRMRIKSKNYEKYFYI